MIIASVFNKIQKLDHKIQILSELTPGLKTNTTTYNTTNTRSKTKTNSRTNSRTNARTEHSKINDERKEKIIKNINHLEDLISQLNV